MQLELVKWLGSSPWNIMMIHHTW